MTNDGYDDEQIVQRYLEMVELYDRQTTLNKELLQTANDLNKLPSMPKDLDKWIDSIPNEKSNFKLADYGKIFKVGRKYDKLVEEREHNMQKIKVLMIDNLIEKIREVIGNE
jgi:hypothetical protein